MSGVLRPALGTLVFALVVVGPVVALVPWVVSGWRLEPPLVDGEASRWIGAPLFLIGLPIWGDAALRFVRQGRGTPAPVAPPVQLVVTGLFGYVRTPMYVGVLAIIFGQALFLGSRSTLIYGRARRWGSTCSSCCTKSPRSAIGSARSTWPTVGRCAGGFRDGPARIRFEAARFALEASPVRQSRGWKGRVTRRSPPTA